MAKLPWKPWHEVVKLRNDLRSGELPMHMFAADLYEVMMQNGKRPIYEKAEEFFALVRDAVSLVWLKTRAAEKGIDSVRFRLETGGASLCAGRLKWEAEGASVRAFPVETLSQSERGYDIIHQGYCLVAFWKIGLSAGKSFEASIRLGG